MIFVTNNVVKSTLVLMFFCSFYYLCWPLGWSGLCFGIWENIPVEFLFVICSRVPKFLESTLHFSYLPTYILFNIYTNLKHLFFFPHSSQSKRLYLLCCFFYGYNFFNGIQVQRHANHFNKGHLKCSTSMFLGLHGLLHLEMRK